MHEVREVGQRDAGDQKVKTQEELADIARELAAHVTDVDRAWDAEQRTHLPFRLTIPNNPFVQRTADGRVFVEAMLEFEG